MNWTVERCEELESLRELVWTCRTLNSGSGVIAKLTRVIELAEKLTDSDLVKAKSSFIEFLAELAVEFREREQVNIPLQELGQEHDGRC